MKLLNDIKENIAYIERCLVTLDSIDDSMKVLSTPIESMIKDKMDEIADMIDEMKQDMNLDGGAGSGNWGHVGVKGQWGGSAPGGGNAFRMTKTYKVKDPKNQFTSKAKIQAQIKKDLKSKSARTVARAQKKMAMTDMEQKSVTKLLNKGIYDTNASKNILGDKNLAKNTTSRPHSAKGTKEAVSALKAGTTAQGTGVNNPAPTPKAPGQSNPAQNNPAQNTAQPQGANQSATAKQSGTAPDPLKTSSRPDSNANYQKALSIDPHDKAATKAFYDEAKQNAKLHTGDTRSRDNGNTQRLMNYMGYDKTMPTLVDQKTFNTLASQKGAVVLNRGCSAKQANDIKTNDKHFRCGGIAYGSGVYFGTPSSAYGSDVQMVAKPDAKILEVDGRGFDSNGTRWSSIDGRGHTQWVPAIVGGYDAIRIQRGAGSTHQNSASDYFLVYNRGAFNVLK